MTQATYSEPTPTPGKPHIPTPSLTMAPDRLAKLPYQTPFLYLDLDRVETAYRQLSANLPGTQIHYAMKCNPARPVLELVHKLGGNFEIASYPELEQLMAIGVDPASVIFSNPVKIASHIERAAEAGVWRFAFDSDSELDKLARYAPGAAVYVRLQVTAGDSLVPSEGKFGVPAEAAADLLRQAAALGLRPYGISFHVGSQMQASSAWANAIATSAGIMRQLQSDGIKLDMLDIGGGFAAHYDDFSPDFAAVGEAIQAALRQHLPYPVAIIAEPGRALVAEAGVMVATIIGTAQRGQNHWLHLDVGAFNGLMESLESGNQLRFPLDDSRRSKTKQTYHLTGPSCDSQDTILYNARLSRGLQTGDKIFIYSAGAYSTVYASNFNGFDIPQIHYAERTERATSAPTAPFSPK